MNKEKIWRYSFIIASIGFLGIVILQFLPPLVFHSPVSMKLIKQKAQIESLDSPEIPDFTIIRKIPTIDFPESRELIHRKLGRLGYRANFFIELETTMVVKKSGNYTFYVASDDGFRLWVDDKMLGEHPYDRGMTTNAMPMFLAEGKHRFRLKYFQRYSGMGLFAGYQFMDSRRIRPIGLGSKWIRFE